MSGRDAHWFRPLGMLLAVLAASWLVPEGAHAQEATTPQRHAEHGDATYWLLLFRNLELRSGDEGPTFAWQQDAWFGGDYQRGWLKTEGEFATDGHGEGEFEVQGLYGRLFSPFWEVQAGVRYDHRTGAGDDLSRAHLVIGLHGLAPYWFEVEPAIFVSQDGDVSARLEASYDVLITQRLILQPDVEINVAAQTVEDWDVGGGLSDVALDLRLRYEIHREFAPYIGFGWAQKFGRTADLSRAAGVDIAEVSLTGGLRVWF